MTTREFRRPDRPPLELLDRGMCPHRSYGADVDEDAREVTCRRCGQRLDPFEVLLWFARDFRRQAWKAQELREAEDKQKRQAEQSKGRAWAKQHGWQWDRLRKSWYGHGHWVGRGMFGAEQGWWLIPEAGVTSAFRAGRGSLLAFGARPLPGCFATMKAAMMAVK